MAYLLNLSSTNWSYYTIPAAWFLCMVPHAYGMKLAGKNFDHASPRTTEEHCAKDTSLDKVTHRRIIRARAAAANGFETLGLYAAAVVAGNAAGVPAARLNALALGYLATRAVYNYIYIVVLDNARLAPLRGICWLTGIAITFGFFISAANAGN